MKPGSSPHPSRSGRKGTVGAPLVCLGLVFLLSGCGSLVGSSETDVPSPVGGPERHPEVQGPVTPPGVDPTENVLGPETIASDPVSVDPILDSPWAREPEMEARVQRWIDSFQGPEASVFRATLARMGQYEGMVSQELRNAGLPRSLLFLPVVESWYNPNAVSWVGAAGLWQFMPPTARGMGMKVDRLIDERRDPYRATPLALAYLEELHGRFDSWFLALAAYNGGPGRLNRILRRYGFEGEGHDGLFLEVLDQLPRETRNFVPRFLAAARIGMDPEAYGFDGIQAEPPLQFEEVMLPDATSLDVVAEASGIDQPALEALNPQLLRGLTPAGTETLLRLPPGTAAGFEEAYARIPPEERVTFLEHTVSQGETLTHIARRHGVSVDDLRAANPRIQPRRMQIGQRVVVPKAPSVRTQLRGGGGDSERADEEERLVLYRVQRGDTLSGIAQRHRVGVAELLRWNQLSRSSTIYPGDEVKIYVPGG